MLEGLVFSIAALLAVFNPFNIAVYFMTLSEGMGREQKKVLAVRATIISALIVTFSALFGAAFLSFLGVGMGSFRIAGGLVLLLMGIQNVAGISKSRKVSAEDIAGVPLASPLMAGPGTISMSILLTQQFSIYTTLIAIGLLLAVALAAMLFSDKVSRAWGLEGRIIVPRVMGLVLVAVAVQFITVGLRG
ncbi:MAG: MarC family protein [Candidatus Micrarchaeia archaeon]|jgi:multiple antibiotic resistance protein